MTDPTPIHDPDLMLRRRGYPRGYTHDGRRGYTDVTQREHDIAETLEPNDEPGITDDEGGER